MKEPSQSGETQFDADVVLEGLRQFQRDAVAHVIGRFYGPDDQWGPRTGRFLIADETGLGKSIIARGIIAKAVEHLEQDDTVDRIDVVYICSNQDLARQNLQRLNVTGNRELTHATRLTLLAKIGHRLGNRNSGEQGTQPGGRKRVNLVSFTPGTSFSTGGWRQGNAEERSLVTLLLDELVNTSEEEQHSTRIMLQGAVTSVGRFDRVYVKNLKWNLDQVGGIDPAIVAAFEQKISAAGISDRFIEIRNKISERRRLAVFHESEDPDVGLLHGKTWHKVQNVIQDLRQMLAQASIDSLKPKLIIFDEFQRFRHLFSEEGGEAHELAQALYAYPGAKVLLLSATPYKPFTDADESGESHVQDFLATVQFLFEGATDQDAVAEVAKVQTALANYRSALLTGEDPKRASHEVRKHLLSVMSRSERPQLRAGFDLEDVNLAVETPPVSDLKEWVALSHLGKVVNAPISLEYWKSIPYFANYLHGYKVEERIREAPRGETASALAATRSLTSESLESNTQIDFGNGPLRALAEDTIDRNWWKLLWIPPSMPYLTPGPVYAPHSDGKVTKHVVFSAWAAVLTAVATLLSHEARRRMLGGGEPPRPRLNYRAAEDQVASMSTLALFWPHPGLANQADQLGIVRRAGQKVTADHLIDEVAAKLEEPNQVNASQPWEAVFSFPDAFLADVTDISVADLFGKDEHSDQQDGLIAGRGLRRTIEEAMRFAQDHSGPALAHPDLARLAVFAPGNISYRALTTVASSEATRGGRWRAAFVIADALRSLFNRPGTIGLLDLLHEDNPEKHPYWRRVLDYCADGNLRAVLEEYLAHLMWERGNKELDDDGLMAVAQQAAAAIQIRPATYLAHEATPERQELRIPTRFAVPYGSRGSVNESDSAVARQTEVRAAFNSPFAPFVLVSTSVGQEGIDFHWWCHSIVHWNLPSNPVDFEQREGRINRYGGHAVRKNVAARHWEDVLDNPERSPWEAAFDAAVTASDDADEFSPWWVYEGPEECHARIRRVLVHYPLSRDIEKYDRLRADLALYRLTLGQPRQQDMIDMLARRGRTADDVPAIDLRPPSPEENLK